jgi:hypothetical protein
MIKTEKIEVNITVRNITYFKNLNYDVKIGESILVKVEDLARYSRIKVDVECDECKNIKKLTYHKYLDNVERYGFYTCKKCSTIKKKITFNNNYGVDNPMKLQMFIDKGKETKFEKYGDENYNNIEQYKITCNEKFGTDFALQNKEVRNKIKNTCNEKYNVDYIGQSDFVKNKHKISNLLKYSKYYKDKNNITIISNDDDQYTIICDKCNNKYDINNSTLRSRLIYNVELCTICNPINSSISDKENKLLNFIKDNYNKEIVSNSKEIIKPYELDIYLPDLNIAFEFNGLYWHNELYKSNDYHNNKTNICLKKGIQLIHIYEDDWIYKQDIIKSMILNKLGKTTNKIYARKTKIKEINDNKIVRNFLDENHIQGIINSSIKIGLYYNNEIVSLMTFGKLRKPMNSKSINKNEYEMLRFCNKLNTNVIGGASKLFKYFIKNYNPSYITSYADRNYSNGNLYNQLGFKLDYITVPNYYYVIGQKKYYRFNFRKDILIKQGFDKNKSEHEIMLERKIYRIYNSGNLKFIYNKI